MAFSGNFVKIDPRFYFEVFQIDEKLQNEPRAIYPKLPSNPCDY